MVCLMALQRLTQFEIQFGWEMVGAEIQAQ